MPARCSLVTLPVCQILAKAGEENLGTLLKNLVAAKHIELSRGAFAWLRQRNMVPGAVPPLNKELFNKAVKKAQPAATFVPGEFDDRGQMHDHHGKLLLTRLKRHGKFIYRVVEPVRSSRCNRHFMVDIHGDFMYTWAHASRDVKPDSWCDDYFFDSESTAILFRYSRVSSESHPAGEVRYMHILPDEQMQALINDDDQEYHMLVESEEREKLERFELEESDHEGEESNHEDEPEKEPLSLSEAEEAAAADLKRRRNVARKSAPRASAAAAAAADDDEEEDEAEAEAEEEESNPAEDKARKLHAERSRSAASKKPKVSRQH